MKEGLQQGIPDGQQIVERRGPYTVTERVKMHDKFGMQLFGDTVINPDGSSGRQYWVNFPRQAVLTFPLDRQGNIYLSKEFTYATNKTSTEVAGGSPNQGESFEDAARRECDEELGVKVEQLVPLGTTHAITSRVNNATHSYLATVGSVGEAHPDSSEVIRLHKVPFNKAVEMVMTGEISTDSVSTGILKIKAFLDSLNGLFRPSSK